MWLVLVLMPRPYTTAYHGVLILALQAAKDDVIPLSEPLRTPDGGLVDHVVIAAGQQVIVPTQFINTSTAYWGKDAHEFRPERWLVKEGIPEKAQEIRGHRHLLAFTSGSRMCLGHAYALVELKVSPTGYALDGETLTETERDVAVEHRLSFESW